MNARDGGPNVARVDGVHVETAGAGSPLVLIHGFAMHGGVFAPLVPALARGHRVHVVDLPGHGASAPVALYDLATLASALDQATVSEEAPLALLGWSLGGMVALEFARARPERVRRLVRAKRGSRGHWKEQVFAAWWRGSGLAGFYRPGIGRT